MILEKRFGQIDSFRIELSASLWALLAVWFLVMTAVPIGIWTIGDRSIPVTMLLGVTMQALFVGTVLWRMIGERHALAVFFGVGAMGLGLEVVGTQTGWPFGVYTYTELLRPQVFHVPILIPLAWFMMMPVAWAVGLILVGRERFWPFVLVSAGAMTAWDLFLDPQMVNWGFWIWLEPGVWTYFGIPWLNYFGWFIGAAGMTAVFYPFLTTWDERVTRPLWLIYGLTWFFETFGLLLL